MSTINFKESNIAQTYSTGLYANMSYDVSQQHTEKVLDIMVSGLTSCLASIKSKSSPVAFVFRLTNGQFIAAAIIEYFPNDDDPKQPGNWNYSWTFKEDDVPKNAKVVTPYDGNIASFFRSTGHTKYGIGFEKNEYMGDMFTYLMDTIDHWLDTNALETEEVTLVSTGIIQFRVAVKDGVKIKSAEVDGEIKQLIKDDAAIEV